MVKFAKITHKTWLKRLLTGLSLLLFSVAALLVSLPYCFDLGRLNETLADNGVKHLGVPLQIRAISTRWGIRPGIRLHNVTAGGRAAATEIELTLAWKSLLGVLVLHQVQITAGQIDLPHWQQWWQSRPAPPVNRQPQLYVRQFRFSDMRVLPWSAQTGSVSGDIRFGTQQQLKTAQIQLGGLTVDLNQTGSALALTAQAQQWQVMDQLALAGLKASGTIELSTGGIELGLKADQMIATGFGIEVSELVLEASFQEGLLEIELFNGDLLGGQVKGRGRVSPEQGRKLKIDWQFSEIDLTQLATVGGLMPLTGAMSASGVYQQQLASGETEETQPSASHWLSSGDVKIERGQIGADGWRFSELTTPFEINSTGIELSDLAIKGYDGTLHGKVDLDWQNKLQLTGQLEMDKLRLKPLLLDSNLNPVSGLLDSKVKFYWQRGNQSVFDGLWLEGDFAVTDGFLPGVDLGMARELLAKPKGPQTGTAFDQAFSKIKVVDGSTQLTEIEISSEVLAVSGDLHIGSDGGLNGTLQIGGNESTGLSRIPVNIDGNLDNPRLRPTKSSLVGGAVGSVLLGPGFGTAVGVKIGEGLNTLKGKLLGSDK